jgi:hypothetical protein
MRTVLLLAFLFVTSLVIAKAGLNWTRGGDEAEERTDEVMEQRIHAEHEEHLERLRTNQERLREHAEALAEKIARDAERAAERAERIAEKAERMTDDIDVVVKVEKLGKEPLVKVEVDEDGYSYSYSYDYDYDYDFDYDFDHGHVGQLVMHEVFDTSPGKDLIIKVPGADLQVITGKSDEAEIFIFLDGDDMKEAQEFFSKLNFDVSSRNGDVYVTAESESDRGWFGHDHGEVTVRAQIPSQFNAELSTSGGDVTVAHLEGTLALATSGGDIELGTISGDGTKVTTSGGDIEAGALRGPIKLTTSGGDIEIGGADGPSIYVTTSGGDIEMGAAAGEEITVKTSGGDIEVGALKARKAVVKTSGGDIGVANADGDLEAATSGGDIAVRLASARNVDLSTTGGSIEIAAPQSIRADVSLEASEVILDGPYDFRGTQEEDRVEGSLNGGGPKIRARSAHGEIYLKMQ